MVLGLMEVDLEAGFDVESVSGGGNLNRSFAGRLNQETSDEVRPLLQNRLENQEDLIRLGIKPVKDKNKKINSKRPPKPPRPPKGPALDASDLKLIRELSELALERRMRIERMKDLKKMRASKAASSNSSSVALIVTVLFCLIILFQGFSSRSGSVTTHELTEFFWASSES
ncbi:unnamed protein product [Rhodiola kirilowii]